MQWFRWYHGTCTDPKLGSIARKVGTTRERALAVWAMLLESASEGEDRGVFSIDPDGIADCLNCGTESVEAIMAEMVARGMIADGRIVAFEKRNPPRDDSAERVRRHRTKKSENGNADVTVTGVTETPPEREEEREGDVETDSLSSSIIQLRERADVKPAVLVDEIIRAANRGMMDNPAIGSAANPIPVGHSTRQNVHDWLTAGIPADVIVQTVYERAKGYRPEGHRRQVTSMAYFTGAVQDAGERWKAQQTQVATNGAERAGGAGPDSGARGQVGATSKHDKYAYLEVGNGPDGADQAVRLRAG